MFNILMTSLLLTRKNDVMDIDVKHKFVVEIYKSVVEENTDLYRESYLL